MQKKGSSNLEQFFSESIGQKGVEEGALFLKCSSTSKKEERLKQKAYPFDCGYAFCHL